MSRIGQHAGGDRFLRLAGAAALVALLGGCSSLQSVAQFLGLGSTEATQVAQPKAAAITTKELDQKETDHAIAELALAQDPVSDSTLSKKRGGFSFGGMFFNFGLSLNTSTTNGLSLSTMLNMNDGGHWTPVATQTASLTLTSTGTGVPPINTTMNQNGSVTFSQSVGDPATTQITNQVSGKNVQTLITNAVNNVTVNNNATLTVQVTGAPSGGNRMATFAQINKFADQMSRLFH